MNKNSRKRKSVLLAREDFDSLSPEDQEKKIIEMLDAHVPINKIAQIASRGVKAIMEIRDRHQQSLKPRTKSLASQAFELFRQGKNVLYVAIELGIEAAEAENYLSQYWRLSRLDVLWNLYNNLGETELKEFILTYNHLRSRGITVDQAIEMRNLMLKVNEIQDLFNSLIKEKAQLESDLPYIRQQRDQLVSQVGNSNFELNKKEQMVMQIRQEYENLISISNSIRRQDITFQQIEQIAKEAAKAAMTSREEQIFTCMLALITILKNDPKLVYLLTYPGPGPYHPDLQKALFSMIDNAWSEISNSVDKRIMQIIFYDLRQKVNSLPRPR